MQINKRVELSPNELIESESVGDRVTGGRQVNRKLLAVVLLKRLSRASIKRASGTSSSRMGPAERAQSAAID